jgi:hypothetical protein
LKASQQNKSQNRPKVSIRGASKVGTPANADEPVSDVHSLSSDSSNRMPAVHDVSAAYPPSYVSSYHQENVKLTAPVTTVRERKRAIVRNFLGSILFVSLALVVEWLIGLTPYGSHLEDMDYSILMSRLHIDEAANHRNAVPISIVDISSVRRQIDDSGRSFTPREAIKAVLQRVGPYDQAAVGIDIDFSPFEHDFIANDDDPKLGFFHSASSYRRRGEVPAQVDDQMPLVYLGVNRSVWRPPDEWLDVGNRPIAAAITTEFDAASEQSVPDARCRALESIDYGTVRGNSLVRALVSAYPNNERGLQVPRWLNTVSGGAEQVNVDGDVPDWLSWAVRRTEERSHRPEFPFDTSSFYVDYSVLDTLQDEDHSFYWRIPKSNPASDGRERICDVKGNPVDNFPTGRIVLIGDTKSPEVQDMFNVPGNPVPVPGLYLLGCSAYTLLRHPLYELTLLGRITLDILLSLVVLIVVTFLQGIYLKQSSDVHAERIHRVLTCVVVVLAAWFGIVTFGSTRLIWTDFTVVLLALLVHAYASKPIWDDLKLIGSVTRQIWRSVVFHDPKGDTE